MKLELRAPLPPMEAELVDAIPRGPQWQYEPKWDGFRCLVFRDDKQVSLQSKSGQSLTRYFPELVTELLKLRAKRFVLDGEIVVPVGKQLSFDQLLARIHPAASRVKRLAGEHPARLIVFDLLASARGESLLDLPLTERRQRLEAFAERYLDNRNRIRISPATTRLSTARRWFRGAGGALDGVIAKRRDLPYQSGLSRWSAKRSTEWTPLAPAMVAEVEYDQFSSGRFRHGVKFSRWRPDKAARDCTTEQVQSHSAHGSLLAR